MKFPVIMELAETEKHNIKYFIDGACNYTGYADKEILINDKKERAEHLTVVDLLRNDLNIVCKDVKVNRFCFIVI